MDTTNILQSNGICKTLKIQDVLKRDTTSLHLLLCFVVEMSKMYRYFMGHLKTSFTTDVILIFCTNFQTSDSSIVVTQM